MQIKDVAPSYVVSIIIALSVYFLKFLPLSYWVVLPLQIVVGISVGFILCEYLQLKEYKEVKGIFLIYVKKLNKR